MSFLDRKSIDANQTTALRNESAARLKTDVVLTYSPRRYIPEPRQWTAQLFLIKREAQAVAPPSTGNATPVT